MFAFEELSVAEEELRAQQETLIETHNLLEIQRNRYQTLFNLAPDPYVVTDAAGNIEEANAAASQLLGVASKLLAGKPLVTFVEPRSRHEFQTQLHALGSGVHVQKWIIETMMRDGRVATVEATVSTLETRDDGKSSLCWLLRDMSARRETEESMQALNRSLNARVAQRTRELELALEGEQIARKEAEAANRIKSELFARLSHEFRTPLHAVSGYLEILQQNIHGGLNAEQRRDVGRIHQAQEHLLALVGRQVEVLAGRAAGHHIVDALGGHVIEVAPIGVEIDAALPVEGRHRHRQDAVQSRFADHDDSPSCEKGPGTQTR